MIHVTPMPKLDRYSHGLRTVQLMPALPLGRGLLRAFHFVQWPPESLEQWSLCGQPASNVAAGSFHEDYAGTDEGAYYNMSSVASRHVSVANASGFSQTKQFTVLVRGYVDATSGLLVGGTVTPEEFAGIFVNYTGTDSAAWAETATTQLTIAGLPADGYYNWGVTYNGNVTGNANRLKFYMNGAKQSGTYTGTIPAATNANTNFSVNRWYVTSAYAYTTGFYVQVLVYNRTFSDEEMLMWHRNRFGMYVQNNTLKRGWMPWAGTGVAAAVFRNRTASRGGMMQHAGGVQ